MPRRALLVALDLMRVGVARLVPFVAEIWHAHALVWVAVTGWRITRREGIALLVAYAAYVGWLAAGG